MCLKVTVCVGNYGYYGEGEMRDRWVDLPMEPDELRSELVAHGLLDETHEEVYISDYDGRPFGIDNGMFTEATPLHQLNMLAQLIEDRREACEVVDEALGTGCECPEDLLGLVNWILQADEMPYHRYDMPRSYAPSKEDFGWNFGCHMAQETGLLDALRQHGAEGYFDFSEYGSCVGNDCYLGESGYVDASVEMPDKRRYGWEDVEAMMPWDPVVEDRVERERKGPAPRRGGAHV